LACIHPSRVHTRFILWAGVARRGVRSAHRRKAYAATASALRACGRDPRWRRAGTPL